MLLKYLSGDTPAMGVLRTVATVVLVISFIVFVALFGRLPIFRRTPIGWTHRLIWIYLPRAFVKLDERVTGRRVSSSLSRFFNYIMNDKHPLVLIFFVTLQLGSEVMFIPAAWSYFSPMHIFIYLPALVLSPYLTLYLCYKTDSSIVPANHTKSLSYYPYDYNLYHPHQSCRTCHLPKPARSKHCSICKTCVSRQDHHCIWINNCVGRNNWLYFILLILSTACLLLYGSVKGHSILSQILQNRFVPPALTRGSFTSKKWSTTLTWSQYLDAWSWAIATNARIGAVTLLAGMSFPLALGFLVYHVYLVWAGTTTNETGKWSDLRYDIRDGLIWKARVEDLKNEYPTSLLEERVFGLDSRAWPKWPAKPEWWVIVTKEGQQPTRRLWGDRAGQEEIDHRWQRVNDMNEMTNLYDLGFWRNLKDAWVVSG